MNIPSAQWCIWYSVLDKAVDQSNRVTVVDNGVNEDTDCVSGMRKHPDCRYDMGCGSTLSCFTCTRCKGQISRRRVS